MFALGVHVHVLGIHVLGVHVLGVHILGVHVLGVHLHNTYGVFVYVHVISFIGCACIRIYRISGIFRLMKTYVY